MELAGIVLVAAINIWISWRYALQPIGPDEGNWTLWGMTGARPYLDFQDIKPPGIHLLMYALAKLTGRRLFWMKLIYHLLVGALILYTALASNSLSVGLLATALLQSSRLFAFQSWMDAMSGALLLAGFASEGYAVAVFVALATVFNVKAAVPGVVFMALSGLWMPLAALIVVGGVSAGLLSLLAGDLFDAMWYCNVTVPSRIKKGRRWQVWGFYMQPATLFVIIALGACLVAGVPLPVLAASLAYAAFNVWGKVWRPNHYLPLAVMVLAAPDPALCGFILLADMASANLYLGNVWAHVYTGIAAEIVAAQKIGEGLKDKPGAVWVDSFHTQIYSYANKPPTCGMVEQLETRDVTPEMATRRDAALQRHPPRWIVVGSGAIRWQPKGYNAVAQIGEFSLLG